MANKKPLPPDRLAECKAANEIFLAKKNKLGLSQRKIAEEADISPASVAFYLSGRNPLNVKFALILSRLLEVPVESFSPRLAAEIAQVAAAADSNVTRFPASARVEREYPLISWVDAGCARESSAPYAEGVAEAWLTSTEQAGQLGYWLKVRGDSMTSNTPPSFPEGTPILVQPEGFDLLSGKFYIAHNHSKNETTFKKYFQDSGIGYLVPLNPAYDTIRMDDDWAIIGRVIDAKITGL